jgi:pimeloyl-ACP methyl ester carboxylesterase
LRYISIVFPQKGKKMMHHNMKRQCLILLISFVTCICFGQTAKTIYIFPGQGSDKRLFDSLTFDAQYTLKFIDYGMPEKGLTLKQFAQALVNQIDTTQKFILLGVSFGGMICCELNEILNPEKVIIISSAKNCRELPFRYRFQKSVPIYKIFPATVLAAGARLLQPIVEPDRNKQKATFKSMLGAKKPQYVKRTITMIMSWDRVLNSKPIVHIHGTNDHTLPFKNIRPTYTVSSGSHMMTLTRAKEINVLLNQEL